MKKKDLNKLRTKVGQNCTVGEGCMSCACWPLCVHYKKVLRLTAVNKE